MKDVDWNTLITSAPNSEGSHPSYEGCGLKWVDIKQMSLFGGHPSYEGCGLKSDLTAVRNVSALSSFVWRMWIEIDIFLHAHTAVAVILRMKDVDWNIGYIFKVIKPYRHPSYEGCGLKFLRAARTFQVLRHPSYEGCGLKWHLWDIGQCRKSHPSYEGCGLKWYTQQCNYFRQKSSFVWRMWIEINGDKIVVNVTASSFVWRMWIEILLYIGSYVTFGVILRMKDVDWNTYSDATSAM